MTDIQPELWLDRAGAAVSFYVAAFGATVLHRVGEGDDIVAQLAVDDAAFWVTSADHRRRLSPDAIGGATGRTLLVVSDPDTVFERAVSVGATPLAPVADEHGWHLGRIIDPFGHEWEIGKPLGTWPPRLATAAFGIGRNDGHRLPLAGGCAFGRLLGRGPWPAAAGGARRGAPQ